MATPAQIQANRQNALKSTGPRTEEGKSQSCQNALSHGLSARMQCLLPGESANSYQRFHQEIRDSWVRTEFVGQDSRSHPLIR